MGDYTSYYLYQKYEKRGDQPFIPSYPAVYSIDGDGTMPLVIKEENDINCGYSGNTDVQYRWVNISISEGYECVGNNKHYKQKKQISTDNGSTWSDVSPAEYQAGSVYEYNSVDCGYVVVQYRWVNMDISSYYVCVGYDKHYKQKKQVSADNGSTWSDVSPAEYQTGSVYEYNSVDCGYVPPTPEPIYRWIDTDDYVCEDNTYSSEYLTFESLEDGNNIRWTYNDRRISASTDGGSTWRGVGSSGIIATLDRGEKLLLKGNNSGYSDYSAISGITASTRFYSDKTFKVYGNIMSLISGDSFSSATTLTSTGCFAHLFWQATRLTDAANLVLPATTLANYSYEGMFYNCIRLTVPPALPATTLGWDCYFRMFWGCSSLTTAPALPATTLQPNCYRAMFYGCSSLTTAPELPATTMEMDCYNGMFINCTSLTVAPALPATTLDTRCYEGMFWGCSSLTTPPVLSATTLTSACYSQMFAGCTSLTTAPDLLSTSLFQDCYYEMFSGCTNLNYIKCLAPVSGVGVDVYPYTFNWLKGVASSGTFVKASGSNWSSGDSGIPYNWTVQEA